MDSQYFQAPAWYQAITWTERIASLRTVQRARTNVEVNAELAERRMQRWRSQAPSATDSFVAQRLARDGITEDELLYLLGEPHEAVRDRFPVPPAWLAQLTEAFSRPHSSDSFSLLDALRGHQRGGFLDVIEPLISQGCDHLRQGIQALTQI